MTPSQVKLLRDLNELARKAKDHVIKPLLATSDVSIHSKAAIIRIKKYNNLYVTEADELFYSGYIEKYDVTSS